MTDQYDASLGLGRGRKGGGVHLGDESSSVRRNEKNARLNVVSLGKKRNRLLKYPAVFLQLC